MTQTRPMAIVTQPGVVEMQDQPVPELKSTDVKVQVKAVTICGSDLHIFKGLHPSVELPVPVGHEIGGEVIEVGSNVSQIKIGDRVAVEPVIPCDTCHFCIRGDYHLCQNISFQYRVGQGGITPIFVVDQRWAHHLPAGISYGEGALLEPLSVAMHAVKKASLVPGQNVAIYGAGAIGLFIQQIVQATSTGDIFIVDINKNRLDFSQQNARGIPINSLAEDPVNKIHALTNGLGADVSFEAVGLPITLRQAIQSLRTGGTGVLVGLFETPDVEMNVNHLVQREIILKGSQGYNWDFRDAISLLERKLIDIKPFITHRFPPEKVQDAFDLLMAPGHDVIKIAIEFD